MQNPPNDYQTVNICQLGEKNLIVQSIMKLNNSPRENVEVSSPKYISRKWKLLQGINIKVSFVPFY
jgi:hypothetical protein